MLASHHSQLKLLNYYLSVILDLTSCCMDCEELLKLWNQRVYTDHYFGQVLCVWISRTTKISQSLCACEN